MNVFDVTLFCAFAAVAFGESYNKLCDNDSTGKHVAERLSNDLFCSYNKNIRPVMNQSTQINVNITLHFFHVQIDEKWNTLIMNVMLTMNWKDEFLVWNTSKYDNIEIMYEDSTKIWIPDIISYNMGFNGQIPNTLSHFLPPSTVGISYQGRVKYNHHITLAAQCLTNLAMWPFDSHRCLFYIGNPVYGKKHVNFFFPDGNNDMIYYKSNKEWNVTSIEHECIYMYNSTNSHCFILYRINVVRFSTIYFSSVIIPALVISLMSSSTLLMGREMTIRIILLCLFFVSELLYLLFLDTKIPNNGGKSVYIVLLYRNCIILTSMVLLVTVISNEFYKCSTDDRPRNRPEWLKSTLKYLLDIRPINMLTNIHTQKAELLIEKNTKADDPNGEKSDENSLFWKTLSILLDRLSFVITLVFSLLNFLAFIP